MSTTALARITGLVQGVGFRAWTQDQASALGLSGWVKNERDGSVAALLSGPGDKVTTMIEKLHRGPPGARVTSVTTEPADARDITGFRILR
jgi:acylphosphatase